MKQIRRARASAAAAVALLVMAAGAQTASAAFPGTNGTIAFHSFQADLNLEIYAMNPDGSGQTRLTRNGARGPRDTHPAYSPDGQKIAFMSNRDSFDFDRFDIYVMNADGTGQTNLTPNLFQDDYPAWSPDGQKIAFVSTRFTGPAIWIMNADGSNPTKLVDLLDREALPNWSPDGQKIAFMSERDGNREIHVINVDGSGETNLTGNPASDVDPNWSPDGQKIAFTSDRSGGGEIWTMNADGSGPTRLTFSGGSEPAFSPNGQRIAFTRHLLFGSNPEIFDMAADGSAQTRLTSNGAEDGSADWAPASGAPPRLFIEDVTVTEGEPATFTVTLLGSHVSPATVDFATSNDTATAPGDYTAAGGTLTFAPTEHSKTIAVPTIDDAIDELTEQFRVVLSNPSSNVAITRATGVATINDNDRDGVFSCFASAVRIGSFEPLQANPTVVPCVDDDHGSLRTTVTSGSTKATVHGTRVMTDQTPDSLIGVPPALGDHATGHTSVDEATITIGPNIITASNLAADARVDCFGRPNLRSSGHVGRLTVNGLPATAGDGHVDIPLILGTLHVNHPIASENEITQRALWASTSVGEAIVGEAKADFHGTAAHPTGDPCRG